MHAIRWLIIRIAEFLVLAFVILGTLGAGASSYLSLVLQGELAPIRPIVGFIIGAVVGFVFTAFVSAAFFLLLEIADNTRKTVAFFERVSARVQARERV